MVGCKAAYKTNLDFCWMRGISIREEHRIGCWDKFSHFTEKRDAWVKTWLNRYRWCKKES